MHPYDSVSSGTAVPGTLPATVSISPLGLASPAAGAPTTAAAPFAPGIHFPDQPAWRRPGLQLGSGLLVDPALISLSSRAMRSPLSFLTKAFAEFRLDIATCGGNVEPVMLRLLAPQADGQPGYELVAGHRRLEACRQLHLDVFCLVVGASDATAAEAMARSNLLHVKPTPYELGCAYVALLRDKVYATQKELARQLGAGESEVTNAQILARLDARLLAAFASPLNLRYRDARLLRDAWAEDPDQVTQRITEVLAHPARTFTHAQTMLILLGLRPAKPDAGTSGACKMLVHGEQTVLATIRTSASGPTVIELAGENWPGAHLVALVAGLQKLLGDIALLPRTFAELDIDLNQLEAS